MRCWVPLIAGLVVVTAGCGEDGSDFNEDGLRAFIISRADADAVEDHPELVDELVDSIHRTCDANETRRGYTIAIGLDRGDTNILADMAVACPARIPSEYRNEVPDVPDEFVTG